MFATSVIAIHLFTAALSEAQNSPYGFGYNRMGQLDLSCQVQSKSGERYTVTAVMGHRIPGACEDCISVIGPRNSSLNLLVPMYDSTSPDLAHYRKMARSQLSESDQKLKTESTLIYSYRLGVPYQSDTNFFGLVRLKLKTGSSSFENRFVLFRKAKSGLPAMIGLCQ